MTSYNEPSRKITATGFNFALDDHSVASRWGLTSAEYTAWISDTAMYATCSRSLLMYGGSLLMYRRSLLALSTD